MVKVISKISEFIGSLEHRDLKSKRHLGEGVLMITQVYGLKIE